MKPKVFIDSDIFLDVALEREAFFEASKGILSLVENHIIGGNTSSLIVCNLHYIISKLENKGIATQFVSYILDSMKILAVDRLDIEHSLSFQFRDFEDGIQNSVSRRSKCDYIITRNTEDFKKSELPVLLPTEFLTMITGKLQND